MNQELERVKGDSMSWYVWFDPQQNELILLKYSLADILISALRPGDNLPPEIIKINCSRKMDTGFITHESGNILEYVGEL